MSDVITIAVAEYKQKWAVMANIPAWTAIAEYDTPEEASKAAQYLHEKFNITTGISQLEPQFPDIDVMQAVLALEDFTSPAVMESMEYLEPENVPTRRDWTEDHTYPENIDSIDGADMTQDWSMAEDPEQEQQLGEVLSDYGSTAVAGGEPYVLPIQEVEQDFEDGAPPASLEQ